MFEVFTYDTEKDLGPLNPNWFEELTAKASRKDESGPSCHEDVAFKLPGVKAEIFLGSQTSTPKQSPGTPASGQIFTESSSYLFGSAKESGPFKHQNSAGPKIVSEPEDTPKRFSSKVVQRISESLGAQINPDLSWSSSLNTPSSMTPTFILSKREEPSSTGKATEERVVFVRELFPPIFKDDILPTSQEDRLSTEKAKEDGELHTTVESVLDGTEEILSFFFTSRKAKTRERGGGTQSDEPYSDATRQDKISSPLKNRNCETTQWTPLSLSEMSGSCSVEPSLTNQHCEHDYATQCHQQTSVACVTDGQKSQSELQLDAPLDAISAPSLSRKPKKFMYPVGDSASSRQDVRRRFYKPLHQSPTMPCPDTLESGQSSERTKQQTGGQCQEVHRSRSQVVPSSTFEKVVDMTQLCKAFAEDFSQEVVIQSRAPVRPEEVVVRSRSPGRREEVIVQSRSPVRREEVLPCQSSSTPSGPEMNWDARAQPLCKQEIDHINGFKTASDKIISFPQEAIERAKALLDEFAESDITDSTALPSKDNTKDTQDGRKRSHLSSRQQNTTCQQSSTPQSPADVSGFRTAADRSFSVSSLSVWKAKKMFKELEDESAIDNLTGVQLKEAVGKAQDLKSVLDVTSISPPADACSSLTASQRADVSELCSLLEDANSQCEFTQARVNSSKPPESAQQTGGKEWDQDILTGINFDDSFSTDVEHHIPVQKGSVKLNKALHVKVENMSGGEMSSQSENPQVSVDLNASVENLIPELGYSDDLDISHKIRNPELPGSSSTEPSLDKCSSDTGSLIKKTPKSVFSRTRLSEDEDIIGKTIVKMNFSVTLNSAGSCSEESFCGFKTAGGRKVHVSETALLQAKALLSHDTESDDTECGAESIGCLNDTTHDDETRLSGTQSAQEASTGCGVGTPHRLKTNITGSSLKAFSGGPSCGQMVSVSVEDSQKAGNLDMDSQSYECVSNAHNTNTVTLNAEMKPVSKDVVCVSSKAQQEAVTLRDCAGYAVNSNCIEAKPDTPLESNLMGCDPDKRNTGFRTAGGKSVFVSEEVLSKARNILSDIPENGHGESDFTKSSVKTSPVTKNSVFYTDRGIMSVSGKHTQEAMALFRDCDKPEKMQHRSLTGTGHSDSGKSFGFGTASGKRMSVSSTALQKAKTLFDECAQPQGQEHVNGCTVELPPVQRHCGQHSFGFSTASGKGISISAESVQAAKALLTDCDTSSETNWIKTEHAHKNRSEKKDAVSPRGIKSEDLMTETGAMNISEHSLCNPRVNQCGFSTASGKLVSVSNTAVQHAKLLFDEGPKPEDSEPIMGVALQHEKQICRQDTSLGFHTASGKGLSISAKSLKAAHSIFDDCSEVPLEILKRIPAFNSRRSTENNCPEAYNVGSCLNITTETAQNGDTKHGEHSSTSSGFSPASGKGVSVSKKALKEACKQLEQCVDDSLPERNTDFKPGMTGSSSGISISAESVQATKALLTDCDTSSETNWIKTDNAHKNSSEKNYTGSPPGIKSEDLMTETVAMNISEHSLCNPRVNQCGFSTASGKLVSVSNTAVQHAKLLFDEGPKPEDSEPIMGVALQHEKQICRQDTSLGFHTASGKGLSISAKSLKAAHAIFDDCSEVPLEILKRIPAVNCGRSTKNNCHTDPEANDVRSCLNITKETAQNGDTKHGEHSSISFGFSTASGKGVSVSKKALKEACKQLEQCVDDALPERNTDFKQGKTGSSSGKLCLDTLQDPKRNQCNSSFLSGHTKRDSSGLSFQSDSLSSCTATQERYFEQEAMACAKALLEDEEIHDDALHVTLGASQVNPQVEKRWSGKRGLENDDSKDQPPLKRRLLAEPDKSSKRPLLVPLKSSPNGVLSDRTVRCNVLLQPNITQPHRTTVAPKRIHDEPELTTPESSCAKQFGERVPMFVPPFRKQTNPERQKGEGSVDHRAPSVFVPPFKSKVNDSKSPFHPAAESVGHTEVHAKCSGFVPVIKKTCPQAEVVIQDNFTPPDPSHGRILPCEDREDFNHSDEHALNHEAPNKDVPTAGLKSPTPSVLKSPTPSEEALRCILLARDMQDMRIRKKKRQTIRPLPGSLFLAKTSGIARVSLRATVGYKCPRRHPEKWLYVNGVPSEVCQVSSGSAKSFQFLWEHFFKSEALSQAGGVQLADGGWLIPDHRGMLGKEQFYRALCDSPGVDPGLISEEWVYNHYRWIVWKRASMERAFPQELGGLCLTPEQVLLQLKYRYDVEVDKSQRSALRRITERDDTPAKTLVLCVCGVETSGTTCKTEGPVAALWLTDGWYALRALLDPPLTALLQRGRLSVGDKLVTHGAELVGSQDACPPLEAPESLMLKISANSTRPARWDARLGYHRDPRPFQLPLGTLFSDGGVVGSVDMLVLRCYPTQWMEKTAGGVFIFRSERAEEREARSHEQRKQKAMEALFSRIQTQLEEEEQGKRKTRNQKRALRRREVEALEDGEELHEAMQSDPTYAQADLREEQLSSLLSFRRLLDERRQVQLQERVRKALEEAEQGSANCHSRVVTPVWKLAVCDSTRQQGSSSSKGSVFLLNIWRPSMELLSLLKEGGRYRAYHLSTSVGKRKATTAPIQLTATKKTFFEHMKVLPEMLRECFKPRQCASFKSLQNPLFHSLCGEVDVVGYVIYIADRNGASPALYLVDEKVDFVSVRCSGPLRQLAVEELVKPRALLIVSNALLRQASAPIPALYAGDFTLFRTSFSEPHFQERMRQLKSFVQSLEHFSKGAEGKLSSLIPMHGSSIQPCPKALGGTSDLCKPPPFLEPITPVDKRTLTASTSEGKQPKNLKKRRGFEYLSRIPSPPPLNPLGTVMSPHVKKTFNPPRRSPMSKTSIPSPRVPNLLPSEDEWVKDEELALIDTQHLLDGLVK